MSIVAFASPTGGVARTTSAITTASAIAKQGHDTLLLDMDLQGQCALGLGFEKAQSVHNWLRYQQPALPQTVTVPNNGLRLLRGDRGIYDLNNYYRALPNGMEVLMALIQDISIGRWVIIDTPGDCFVSDAVITCADVVVIPFCAEGMSKRGVIATMALIAEVNPKTEVILLPTQIDRRLEINRRILAEMQNEFGDKVAMPVPRRAAMLGATRCRKTIWDYKGDGVNDVRKPYSSLVERLLAMQDRLTQADEILYYKRLVAELQAKLADANLRLERQDLLDELAMYVTRLELLERQNAKIDRSNGHSHN